MYCYQSNEHCHLEVKDIVLEAGEDGEMNVVRVYPELTKQAILGFGGCFTEAAAYTWSMMGNGHKAEIMDAYFSAEGSRYSFCRTHIQSCDFSLGNNAYITDAADTGLKGFSLAQDEKYVIPFIKEALKRNMDIEFLASPWSPPAFMKSNHEMNHGGVLLKEYYSMWARIMVRYLIEYRKLGIRIGRLTVQNEPAATQTWESCCYTAQEEKKFACDYLRKELDTNGLYEVKINIWDHNKEKIYDRAVEIMNDDKAEKVIDGIAFHWYTGDHFESLQAVRERFPDKELIFTEGCVEYSRFDKKDEVSKAEMYAHDMIGDFNAGMNAFMDWNLLLDKDGGPNHVNNFCDAPIMCDSENDSMKKNLSYYYIGQFSRFIKPGAKRVIVSRYTDKLETCGFVNPDGSKVLVVLNRQEMELSFRLVSEKKHSSCMIPPHSIQTYVW